MIDPKKNGNRTLRVRYDSGAILVGPAIITDEGDTLVLLGGASSLLVRRADGSLPLHVAAVETLPAVNAPRPETAYDECDSEQPGVFVSLGDEQSFEKAVRRNGGRIIRLDSQSNNHNIDPLVFAESVLGHSVESLPHSESKPDSRCVDKKVEDCDDSSR